MKQNLKLVGKLILGILSPSLTFTIIAFLVSEIINIHDYSLLKWIFLLICATGFYLSGLINRKTPLVFIPILLLGLLIFIPLRGFFFPLTYFLFLFAIISLLLTRKELGKKIKIGLFSIMSVIFIYFLFSQPLIIIDGNYTKVNQYGDLINGKVIWDFTKEEKIEKLPETIFLNINDEEVDLKEFKNKKIYVSFWATWCGPCHIEKPELEKLKKDFNKDSSIVFIDISLDSDTEDWKQFLEKNKPNGLQLISRDNPTTRNLFRLPGIPEHIVVNKNFEYRKARVINTAYEIFENDKNLDKYINKEFEEKITKYYPSDLDDFKKVDSVKVNNNNIYFTNNKIDILTSKELNSILKYTNEKVKPNKIDLMVANKPITVKDTLVYEIRFVKK